MTHSKTLLRKPSQAVRTSIWRTVFVWLPIVIWGAWLVAPLVVQADTVSVPLEVPIGSNVKEISGDNANLLKIYIGTVYKFLIGSVGIIATTVIVYHGFRWATAVGNQTVIGKSKEGIVSALIGVILAVTSYVVLNTINPSFVALESLVIADLAVQASSGNSGDTSDGSSSGSCSYSLNTDTRCTGLVTLKTDYINAHYGRLLQMDPAAAAAAEQLAKAFYERYNKKIQVNYAFRSYALQQCIVTKQPAGYDTAAGACSSPHNGGAAMDISSNPSALTQEQYNWLVCGSESTCACTPTGSSGWCKSNVAHYGFKVRNYNPNQQTKDLDEQHHFDFENSTSVGQEVCNMCPTLTECDCGE